MVRGSDNTSVTGNISISPSSLDTKLHNFEWLFGGDVVYNNLTGRSYLNEANRFLSRGVGDHGNILAQETIKFRRGGFKNDNWVESIGIKTTEFDGESFKENYYWFGSSSNTEMYLSGIYQVTIEQPLQGTRDFGLGASTEGIGIGISKRQITNLIQKQAKKSAGKNLGIKLSVNDYFIAAKNSVRDVMTPDYIPS